MKPIDETWEHISGAYPSDVYRTRQLGEPRPMKVAEVWHDEMNDAAALIAAAPELYRALADLVEHARDWHACRDAIDKAVDAMKKARGE